MTTPVDNGTARVNEALAKVTLHHGSCEGECDLAIILREVSRLRSALTEANQERARAAGLLELYGVPPERTRELSNGIDVLETRMRREIQGLEQSLTASEQQKQDVLNRALFYKGNLCPESQVLWHLHNGNISVGKCMEWLREYISTGKQGPLPETL